MTDFSYEIRTMREEDVPGALKIWKEAKQPEGKNCLYTWMRVDPTGCKVAVSNSDEVIAACCGIIQNEEFAFIGLYVCKESYRGQGIGLKVFQACMEHIGPNRNAGLNAVPGKLELYRDRAGFTIVETDWTSLVYQSFDQRVDPTVLSNTPPEGVQIGPYDDYYFPRILDYDRYIVGYSREKALKLTFQEGDSRTLVALKHYGKLIGFGTIKLSIHDEGQIGPLYADDPQVAEVLLRRLIEALPQATGFAMMTVSVNEQANELVRRLGCPLYEECPRLYTKETVKVDTSKVYGQFDLDFTPA